MTASRPNHEAIFHAARAIPEPDRRRAYVHEACGGDEARVAHVAALLAAAEAPDSLLDRSAGSDPLATIDQPAAENTGTVIGPYRLTEPIGEGGMGTVWMAQQTAPVKRRVAVKLIKAGMDSRQVIARFEAERRALALMDHPHIARVLDAGATEAGRPYFVMELVKGLPITRYCDERRLSVRQRLELFVPVCQAVQHAHQKGIIHRDLKPSNVLVAEYDGRPVPKVIDFGVAKATGQQLTEQTLHTGFGAVVGTPEYMSPEQAGFNQLDIDTRSDIYSLGVLLYELLAGSPPFTRKELERAGVLEMLRVIREREPTRPSTRLSTAEGLPTLAANRGTEPRRLARLVRGELDWIVMKALEKDRSRRYETANGLAADVQRYLADEVVAARPPGAGYRLGKFLRRNRGPVAAVLVASVSGVVGLGAVAVVQTRSNRELKTANEKTTRALAAETKARNDTTEALGQSEAARRRAEAVLGFLKDDVLAAARPEGQEGGLGVAVTVRKAVDAAEPKIAEAFRDQPLVEAEVRDTLGETYSYLGEAPLAIRQFERVVELRRTKLAPDHSDTLKSRNNLATAYLAAGRTTEAITLHEANLKQQESKLGPDHPLTLTSRTNLATAYWSAGRTADAIILHEANLKQQESKLGPDHSDTLKSRNNLATAYLAAGRTTEAITLLEANLKQRESQLGPDHPDTLTSRNNLASAYWSAGRTADAITLDEATLKLYESQLGPDHPDTLTSRNNLASAYLAAGRTAEAVTLHEATLTLYESKLGPDHPKTLLIRANLAVIYLEAGRTAEAITLHEATLKQRESQLGPDHPDTLSSRGNLAKAYRAAGRLTDALPLFEGTLKRCRAELGPDHPRTLQIMNDLAGGYLDARRWAEAERTARECLDLRAMKQPGDWWHFHTMSQLGGALAGQTKYADAEPLILDGYEGMKTREAKIPVPSKPRLTEAAGRIVRLYEAWDKPEQATAWKVKLGMPDLPADVYARP
jgi:serine/threonine protein kinase/tetratricopeptide (TPR) repeat protein